jgi:type IV pilus assembly protein PilZ
MSETAKPHLANLKLKPGELNDAYLPFIEGGGLFIPTVEQNYELGEEIFLKVDLEGEGQPYRLIGKVAWISSHTDHKEFRRGIGIQFQDAEGKRLNQEIKSILATLKNKD